MAFRPHKFGRYIIVDPIAVGGMAEIYRARLAAAKEGPDRIIVIKKVIANLSQNSEFIQMFEEEIKITVGLTHPNIIQIYDYGKVEDQYFMAMEYVEGKNLRQFVKRLADMKSMFSIDMSCHIISQVCHALAYAHSYKDRMTGKVLGIVHRDISPQNVIISYEGSVKLFDFGIAKAKSASEATRAGVIKGKPSYLSPEQINGEELDGRCDIFALGIVLWELLTAKRLFVAETDMGVLRLIQSAKIEPPSTFNPAIPQALDAIVIKSLLRDKVKRYQTAEEFQRDLHKFVYSFNPSFNPADLSYYAQELFKSEIREDRERLTKFLAMAPEKMEDANGLAEESTKSDQSKKSLSTKLADGLMSTTDFNREMMDMVLNTDSSEKPSNIQMSSSVQMPSPKKASMPTPGKQPAPPTPAAGKAAPVTPPGLKPSGLKTDIIVAPPGMARKPGSDAMVIPPWSKPGSPSSGGSLRTGSRTGAQLRKEMDSQNSGSGRNVALLLGIMAVGLIVVGRQYGFLEGTPLDFLSVKQETKQMADNGESKPKSPSESAPVTPPRAEPQRNIASQGVIVFRSEHTDFQVRINGSRVPISGNQVNAPLNTPLNIDVIKSGFKPLRFQTTLTNSAPAGFEVNLVPLPSGTLEFTSTPQVKIVITDSNGVVVVDSRTPLKGFTMAAGVYKVLLENQLLSYRSELELEIHEGKLTRKDVTIGR
jgi:serine/threonine protein kinase